MIEFTAEELEFLAGVLSGMQFQGDAAGIRKILALHEVVMGKVMVQLEGMKRSASEGGSVMRRGTLEEVGERRGEKGKR